jgi:hypothetical protein
MHGREQHLVDFQRRGAHTLVSLPPAEWGFGRAVIVTVLVGAGFGFLVTLTLTVFVAVAVTVTVLPARGAAVELESTPKMFVTQRRTTAAEQDHLRCQ